MDIERLADAVRPRTRAILPVHLYGQPAPVELIRPIADAAGAAVVEDAAQSQGARRAGVATGTFGDLAATSFYPGKNLGAYGDGGAVLTDDAELAGRVRLLREHGSPRNTSIQSIGFNSRLDTLQAVVLSAKLRRLEVGTRPGVRRPPATTRCSPTSPRWCGPWSRRQRRRLAPLRRRVRATRRGAARRFTPPASARASTTRCRSTSPAPSVIRGGPGSFPVAERLAGEILSLPLYPEISPAEQERVVDALRAAVR